jgi:uncharacterized protein (TIGR00369 family)
VSFEGTEGPQSGRDVSRYVRIAMREDAPNHITAHAPAASHLLRPDGTMRTGALLTMLDNVGGICSGLAALPDGWVVSTNLAARVLRPISAGPLRIEARVLRRGRNNVVTAVEIHDEGGDDARVADGVLTSAILVPENGPPQWSRPVVIDPDDGDRMPPAVPMREWLGLREHDAGTVEIELAEELRNPWGILHGGVVASLVDFATEHATARATGDVVLHFLAPNRVGPVRASARVLGERSDGTVCRVEVRDAGADRLTAVAIATARE